MTRRERIEGIAAVVALMVACFYGGIVMMRGY